MTALSEGISRPQRSALDRLAPSLPPSVYLAGGVAVALRCGHRASIDLDLFTPDDPVESSLHAIERVPGVVITVKKARTLYLMVDGIPTSILGYDYPHLAVPEAMPGLAVPVASVPDLVTMKLSAIADRGARRDFWDLHELMRRGGLALDVVMEWQRRRYPQYDLGHAVRALTYFADADASPRTSGLTEERWEAIKTDLVAWVRTYTLAP